MSPSNRYRSRAVVGSVVGFSISYQRDNLLSRGLGLEHLRELLVRIARPLLRQGASLSYAGTWIEREDNFTYELLRLISAEQEDNSLGGPDTSLKIGQMYNHCAWPYHLAITPELEARWIHYCRIIRISQELAGIPAQHRLPDTEQAINSPTGHLYAALALSAMRRLMMTGVTLQVPDAPSEMIPPVVARVLLGGRLFGFSGFIPGVLEEALVTLKHGRPLYVLGGFGGAGEVLARGLLEKDRPRELTLEWQLANTPRLSELMRTGTDSPLAGSFTTTPEMLDELWEELIRVKGDLSAGLNTGLDEASTRELMTTTGSRRVVKLVREGLGALTNFSPLPA